MAAGKIAGEVFIERLAAHGVDYLFANGGTDFAPVIEALAARRSQGVDTPQALPIPHETVALGMAHGYALVTGRPQAVMVHTNVGLANVVMGAINAAAEQIPMLICSGATPLTETGRLGSRSTPINWGQDMEDQAALVRESVKWNSMLNYPEQIGSLVDRAMAISQSAPTGPVYLGLPREPLSATLEHDGASAPQAPAAVAPHPDGVAEAAALLKGAERPLIIAHRGFQPGADAGALAAFAEEFAIPVVEFWPSRISLDSEHPMHAGFAAAPDVTEADAILVLNALTPWIPDHAAPAPGCKVIQAGPDPLHARFPIRGFRSDVSLTGDADLVLGALGVAMRGGAAPGARDSALDARHDALAERNAERRAKRAERSKAAAAPMSMEYVSWCVGEALGEDGVIFNELGVDAGSMPRTRPGAFFSHAVSGGLGWGLTAALGGALALKDSGKVVAACVGDGSYMFANPVACHQAAEALGLKLLTIVMNNGVWNAVRRSTLEIFPDGAAAKANLMPVTTLEPAPDYCKVAEASRAWTEAVDDPAELPAALKRALAAIAEGRQALLNVRTGTGAGEGR